MTKKYLDNLPLIVSLFYIFSAMMVYLYYSAFDINIFNYCSILDILTFPITPIFSALILLLAIYCIIYFIGIIGSMINESIYIFFKSKNGKSILILFLIVFVLLICYMFFCLSTQLITLVYYMILFFPLAILLYSRKKSSKNIDWFILIYFILIVFITQTLITKSIKTGQIFIFKDKIIEFNYNEKHTSTSPTIKYIGQTHEYIFLYNRLTKTSEIYKTTNIDSIRIKNIL